MNFSFVALDILLRHDLAVDEVLFDASHYIHKDLMNCFCNTIVNELFDFLKIQTHPRWQIIAKSFCFIAMTKKDKERYWECIMFAAYAEVWCLFGENLPNLSHELCRISALDKYREMLYNFLVQETKCPLN